MTAEFKNDVLEGLKMSPKKISPKYFYDERGSELFEKICDLKEYYPTRTEMNILKSAMGEISERIGPHCMLFEFGSGSSTKTRILLDNLPNLSAYFPIDISGEFLSQTADRLQQTYPELRIFPICTDFTLPIRLDEKSLPPASRKVGFLPGSTLGNFHPDEASEFLGQTAAMLGENGQLLIGIDLVKDFGVLEAAYNDPEGITAEFNLNLLHRLKNELGAKIEIESFEHRAFFNRKENRIEMHLKSKHNQNIEIDGVEIDFGEGESIHTENSYKYTPESFEELVLRSGFEVSQMWTDPNRYFGVFLLDVHESLNRFHTFSRRRVA